MNVLEVVYLFLTLIFLSCNGSELSSEIFKCVKNCEEKFDGTFADACRSGCQMNLTLERFKTKKGNPSCAKSCEDRYAVSKQREACCVGCGSCSPSELTKFTNPKNGLMGLEKLFNLFGDFPQEDAIMIEDTIEFNMANGEVVETIMGISLDHREPVGKKIALSVDHREPVGKKIALSVDHREPVEKKIALSAEAANSNSYENDSVYGCIRQLPSRPIIWILLGVLVLIIILSCGYVYSLCAKNKKSQFKHQRLAENQDEITYSVSTVSKCGLKKELLKDAHIIV